MVKKITIILIIAFISFILFSTYTKAVVVVLDPGHGGEDSGAVGNGLREADVNFKISTYTAEELNKYIGITVYLTHYGINGNQELTLKDRADIAAARGANILISQHINASTDTRSKRGRGMGYQRW